MAVIHGAKLFEEISSLSVVKKNKQIQQDTSEKWFPTK